MNIYFSCSLTGGRNDESVYAAIVDHLLAAGHAVPTAHLARPDVMDLEQIVDPGAIFHRDLAWIRECEALIAEVSTPSHGVGYEIAYALGLGKPVLCCFRRGGRVSKMITGNDSPGMTVREYAGPREVLQVVNEFLAVVREGANRAEKGFP
jgi:nucleoside 2-deoxyribosyltransferase